MRLATLLLAFTIALGACGGGDAPASAERRFKLALFASEASIGLREQRRQATAVTTAPPLAAAAVLVDPVDAATQLIDFGEASFPTLFPGHEPNLFWEGYVFRHYPSTGTYLGVREGMVFVLGGPLGEQVRAVGALTDFITPVVLRASVSIGAAGGELEINDSRSPLAGLKLTVPAATFNSASVVALGPGEGVPALDADLTLLGRVVTLASARVPDRSAMRLTLPYVNAAANDAIVVMAFDAVLRRWVAVPVVSLDAAAQRITVMATRLTHYAVVKLTVDSQLVRATFKPSVNAFRISNGVGATAAGQAGGFLSFGWWYQTTHGSCPALGNLSNVSTQNAIVSEAQARVRYPLLPPPSARLPWSSFVQLAKRELRAGRPLVLVHLDMRTAAKDTYGQFAQEPRLNAMLAYEANAAGDALLVYDPSRGPADGRSITAAMYNDVNFATHVLAPSDFYDDAELAAVFQRHRAALGCAPPNVTLNASASSVTAGQSVTLSWSAQAALSCTASGDWSGTKNSVSGSESVPVGALPGARNYALRCNGVEGSSATASTAITVLAAPVALCANVAGSWTEDGTLNYDCDSGDSGSESASGRGVISQQACNIDYTVMGIRRSGTVQGQSIRISGPAALAEPGASLHINTFTFVGTVSADARRIDATGSGMIAGTVDGVADTCRLTSTSVLRR